MKNAAFAACIAALLLGAAASAQQPLTLEFRDARVTLDAHDVPVQQILREWARIGGTQIVNGDKVPGGAVTLQLIEVPERQALDVVLRSVSGYMLAMREPGTAGPSAIDRILILPTSVAPRNPPPASRPAAVSRPMPRPLPQTPTADPDADPVDVDNVGGQPSEVSFEPPAGVPGLVAPGVMPPGEVPTPIASDSMQPAEVSSPIAPGVMPPTSMPNPVAPGRVPPGTAPFNRRPPFGVAPPPATLPGAVAQPQAGPSAQQPAPGNPFGLPRGSGAPGIVMPPVNPASPFTPGATIPPPMDQQGQIPDQTVQTVDP